VIATSTALVLGNGRDVPITAYTTNGTNAV